MLDYVDVQSLKEKLGYLLARMKDGGGISTQQLSEKMIADPYFDFLERNNPRELLDLGYEEAGRRLFGPLFFLRNEIVEPSYLWAGKMYMTIAINVSLPLRVVFLLCPLEKMIGHFLVFHEMNDSQMVNEFMANEGQVSILKTLRHRNGISVRDLSLLSSLSEGTIGYYEKDNSNLRKASFSSLHSLAMALGVGDVFFLSQSNFLPFSYHYFEIKELRDPLLQRIKEYILPRSEYRYRYYGSEDSLPLIGETKVIYFIKGKHEENEKKDLTRRYGKIVFIEELFWYYRLSGATIKKNVIDEKSVFSLARLAVNETLSKRKKDELIF